MAANQWLRDLKQEQLERRVAKLAYVAYGLALGICLAGWLAVRAMG